MTEHARRVSVSIGADADVETVEYDLAIATLGYEARSSAFWRSTSSSRRRSTAFGFMDDQILSFDANRRLLKDAGFDVRCVSDEAFAAALSTSIAEAAKEVAVAHLLVDVSSLTRRRIAALCESRAP